MSENNQKTTSLTLPHDVEPEAICGEKSCHMKHIMGKSNVQIQVNGRDIIITGDTNAKRRKTKAIINGLVTTNRNGGMINNDLIDKLMVPQASDAAANNNANGASDTFGKAAAGIKPVSARNAAQAAYFESLENKTLVFGVGPAGTGKTYLAVAAAVSAFKAKKVDKIILCRPAVESGERLGFLPGDMTQKIDPYLRPLYDALDELLGIKAVKEMLESRKIEIAPLAFMRGRTLNKSFVILDEAQNATDEQTKMFLTRIGIGSKAVLSGDITQIDLVPKSNSGLEKAMRAAKDSPLVAIHHFTSKDIVRAPIVQDIIQGYERIEEERRNNVQAPANKPEIN